MPQIRKLLVASSKGGVGKSTAALGVAAEFAKLGKRVILADTDCTSRSLDLLTGCEDRALFNLADLIDGDDPEKIGVVPYASLPELRLIPAPTVRRLRELCHERDMTEAELMWACVGALDDWDGYDLLVCDTGGGLDAACSTASFFDRVLVVSGQSQTSVRAAEYAASRLERCGNAQLRLCVCGFDLSAVRKEKRAGLIEMIDASSLQLEGVIPFDPGLALCQDRGQLPPRNSPVTVACRNIALRILGRDVPLFEGMPALARRRQLAL